MPHANGDRQHASRGGIGKIEHIGIRVEHTAFRREAHQHGFGNFRRPGLDDLDLVQIRHGDVEFAAIRLEDHGMWRAAELQVAQQHVALEVDHGNFLGIARGDECRRAIRQHHHLLGMLGDADRGKRCQRLRVKNFQRGIVAVGNEQKAAIGREPREPRTPPGAGAPGDLPGRGIDAHDLVRARGSNVGALAVG